MAHAEIDDDDHIFVRTEWNEKELIKQVPGARWRLTSKTWTVPLTWTACVTLQGVFTPSGITFGNKLLEWGWKRREEIDTLLTLRAQTRPGGRVPNVDTRLYPFQQVGSGFLLLAREVLLGDEMGTGKTIQALAAIAYANGTLPAIVICPNSVKTSWARETKIWYPSANPYVITGGVVGRRKILAEAAKDPNAIVIVNIEAARLLTRLAAYGSIALRKCRECDKHGEEGLKSTQCQVHPKELNKIPFKTVIIDEAHRIKNPQSQQTRAAWAIAHMPSVVYRWAMTGTPIANHPGDLWSLMHAVSPRDFPTKTHYVDRYCLQTWAAFGGLEIVGLNPANRDEFYKIFDPHFRRMPKDLVLAQLPPKVRSVRWVEMTPAQRKMYNDFENGLGTMTAGGVLIAPNALIARMRQMQLASSQVTIARDLYDPFSNVDTWSVELVEPSPKLDALEEVLEEAGGRPVVVCAEHRKLIELASARLTKKGIRHGLITGKISEYERDVTLREFQAGKIPVLLFTVKAGGVGLTMTAADTIVFLQRSWSMVDNKQAEDRVHRIGSEVHESIHVIDIVTRDTVEEGQIASLHEKFMRLQEITRDRLTIARGATTGFEVAVKALDEEEARIMSLEL